MSFAAATGALEGTAGMGSATGRAASPKGDFSAALEAERRALASQRDQADTLASIKDKGFGAWVRDVRVEKLKEEIRKKILAAKGLDEDSLAGLNDSLRQAIEKEIEELVTRRLEEALKDEGGTGQKPPQSNQPDGQNLPTGPIRGAKRVPVIPALVTPGGPSVLG